MARKSGPRQLKREPSPAFWPINRKRYTWVARPTPGGHPRSNSLPLVMVMREILGYAKTSREAARIINSGKVKVDGVVRKGHRFPVGLMDVLQIDGATDIFRLLPKHNQGLVPSPIGQKEAEFKLCKIVGKRSVTGGKTQINLHDGRNLIVQVRESRSKETEEYAVGATIQLALHDHKIMSQIPFQKGAIGLVVDGQNLGLLGTIEAISPGTHARQETVTIAAQGRSFETPAAYVIPVGTDKPLVEAGE